MSLNNKQSSAPRRRQWLRRRFLRGESGNTAVEFAIVAPLFIGLMMSIFEVGWFYFVNATVDAATSKASRFVRTGQAFHQATDKDSFFNTVCDVLDTFGSCDETLTVDVEILPDFGALVGNPQATCRDAPQSEIDQIPYNPGAENDIVRVRVCFLYKTLNPMIGTYTTSFSVSETNSDKRRIVSTFIFRNEPFERN